MIKLEKVERFNLIDLSIEDISFLSEIFEKVSLSEDSSPLSRELLEKWKTLVKEFQGSESSHFVPCEGCSRPLTLPSPPFDNPRCPLSGEVATLCVDCYKKREDLANEQTDS